MKNSFTEWLIKLSKANNNKNDLMIPHNSIPNPIEKVNESMNEDVCFVSKNKIGIADGAGGVGIFCKDWANYLLKKTPDYSFNSKDEISIWYNNIREDFYNEIQRKTKEYDDFVIDKFEKVTISWRNFMDNALEYNLKKIEFFRQDENSKRRIIPQRQKRIYNTTSRTGCSGYLLL